MAAILAWLLRAHFLLVSQVLVSERVSMYSILSYVSIYLITMSMDSLVIIYWINQM